MPSLLSGSTLRRGGSSEFIDLKGAMPQLPPTETTATGFTLVTDSLYRTTYSRSLGYVEIENASMRSLLPSQQITINSTGTVLLSTSTSTGILLVRGGIGVTGNMFLTDDIIVNGLTIGQGYRNETDGAWNNIVIKGTASTGEQSNDLSNGQENISIGYNSLINLDSAYKSIAIGRYALSTGTRLRNSIAIGDSALKNVGILPTQYIKTITGISVTSSTTITNISNANPAVVTSTDHGLTTGQRISISDVVGISTGTTSLLNGHSYWVDVYNSNTFGLYTDPVFSTATSVNSVSLGSITWSPYTSGGKIVHPIEISVTDHDFITGTSITVYGIEGLEDTSNPEFNVPLNDRVFYVTVLDSTTVQIYNDPIIGIGVDGTNLTPYTGGGFAHRVLKQDDNVAVGNNAGKKLIDGERNFFLGDNIATNLTTGSYNFFIGHDAGNGMTVGTGNVSIMGDNLVDGRDNQISIGGIFYYDGAGYLRMTADTAIGLGSTAEGGNTGALAVFGGISVSDNIVVANGITVGNINANTGTVVSALYSNNVVLASYTSPVLTTTTSQIVDSFTLTDYRTARYTAQVTSGSDVHVTELVLFHDGVSPYINEYGTFYTTQELGVFDSSINGATITLTFTPASVSSTTVKIVRMALSS